MVVVGGIVDCVFAREDGTNPDTVQLCRRMHDAIVVTRVFIVAMKMKMEKVWFLVVNATFRNRELRRTRCIK